MIWVINQYLHLSLSAWCLLVWAVGKWMQTTMSPSSPCSDAVSGAGKARNIKGSRSIKCWVLLPITTLSSWPQWSPSLTGHSCNSRSLFIFSLALKMILWFSTFMSKQSCVCPICGVKSTCRVSEGHRTVHWPRHCVLILPHFGQVLPNSPQSFRTSSPFLIFHL